MQQLVKNSCFLMLVLLFGSSVVSGQLSPTCHYDFNNDDLTERTGNFLPGEVRDNINYICGVGENSRALLFDGSIDTVFLDPAVKNLFDEDFTFSMSFWVDPVQGAYTLFSIQDSCIIDSSFIITYTGVFNEVTVEFARTSVDLVFFSAPLDELSCWHEIIFVRDQSNYSFYLNGELLETKIFTDEIVLRQQADVEVGFSDCVPRRDEYFSGRIDEIRVFDTAIGIETVTSLNSNQENLITQDTTIFEGDGFQIVSGPTCSDNVSWQPAIGLDQTDIPNPFADPTETTSYRVQYNNGSCTSEDSLTVFVINENDIDCSNLLLPSAFTPNGDRLNDTYGISNEFIIQTLDRFEIFDRWGTKLFETQDKSITWDGRFEGEDLMPSSYVYKIEYSCMDMNFAKTGTFNLIK